MIKINLLPYRAARKKEIITRQVAFAALPLFVTLLIIGILWWSVNSQNAQAAEDIKSLKGKIEQSKLKMKDIDTFKSQKETLEKKMEVIKTLEKNKTGPVRMLDEIATCLPGNLWLTKLDQKGNDLLIEGRSLDNLSVSKYMVQLEDSTQLSDLMLGEIKTDIKGTGSKGLQLKSFKLNAKVAYKAEAAQPVKK